MKQTLDLDIVVISWLPHLYANRRLAQEAEKIQLTLKVLNTEEITPRHAERYRHTPHLVRISDYKYPEVLSHLQQFNLPYINNLTSFATYRDKIKTYQIWQEQGIPFPTSYLVDWQQGKIFDMTKKIIADFTPDDTETAFRKLNQLFAATNKTERKEFILKLPLAMKGKGIYLVKSVADLASATSTTDLFLAQFYHPECYGEDIRVFITKNEMHSIQRKNPQDFRSNLALGGSASRCKLSPQEKEFCQRLFAASGLSYAGIDFLRTNHGPRFLEINVSPGFEGIEKTYEVNIAQLILKILQESLLHFK